MGRFRELSRRRAAVMAVALGSALLLVGGLPTRGQQNAATVEVAGITHLPRPSRTGVTVRFALPQGHRLVRPWVRLFNSRGELVVLMVPYLAGGANPGQAYIELNTDDYPPDTYRVRAEVEHDDAAGVRSRAISTEVPLVVAAHR